MSGYVFRQCGSKDGNHREIVLGLEAAGRSVLEIWNLPPGNRRRKGAPDILVGWGGHCLLMEIKRPEKASKVSEEQRIWHAWWKGPKPVVVRTLAEALAYTGVHIDSPVDKSRFAGDDRAGVIRADGESKGTGESKGPGEGDACERQDDLIRGRRKGLR